MNFAELQDELYARGSVYLRDAGTNGRARAQRWINQAYQQICEAEQWPFLETDVTKTHGETISDLRQILDVRDSSTNYRLRGIDRRQLAEMYPDLTLTGSPTYYYLEDLTIKTFPVTTTSLSIRYLKVPEDLDASEDPVIPSRFHDIIVDAAYIKVLKDTDDFEKAQALEDHFLARFAEMRASLLLRDAAWPRSIHIGSGTDW